MSAQPPLRPGVGFCIQTDSSGTPPGRWFVNVCKHKLVDLPVAYSGKEVTKDWILTHGIGNLRVPFDLGSFRKLKERAEGSRHTTYVVDVVFNPLIVQLFMDDEFCNTMEQYRPWVLNLALNRIEESIGVKLSTQKVKLVKSLRYKDGEDGGPTPLPFTDLPGDKDDMGFDEEYVKQPPSAASVPSEPLIEDVTPGTRKKPAMKKGFFNNKSAAGSLYGDQGSKEGVLPENAGDPMGWMPKKLRNNSKIIDCNSPEYQAQEKQRKAAESSNAINKEWKDTMMEGFEKLQKKQDQNKWEDDLPDGTEQQPKTKYDVDYSRFDSIADEADDRTPSQPERDWYVDTNGQMRRIQPEATGSQQSGAPTNPAVKKGFLESAKTSLYGPEGSSQGKAPKPGDEEQLLRDLEKMMSPSDMAEAKQFADSFRDAKPPSVAVKTPASPDLKAPDFSLTDADGALSLSISVPELSSMKGVDLDVTERSAAVTFPTGTGLRPLKIELPSAVIPTKVKAKFSKKTHQIVVTLPTREG